MKKKKKNKKKKQLVKFINIFLFEYNLELTKYRIVGQYTITVKPR